MENKNNTKQVQLKENEKILVCDFRRIGDGIMSLPIFEALKKRYPSCYTIFVCENIAKGIGDGGLFLKEIFCECCWQLTHKIV